MARSLALLALVGASVAQSTVDIMMPFGDDEGVVATLIGSDATMTTYALACATDAPDSECMMPYEDITVSQGPSSWGMTVSLEYGGASYAQSAGCTLNYAKDEAVCSASAYGDVDGTSTATSTEDMTMDFKTLMVPVTIIGSGAAAAPKTTSSAASQTGAAHIAAVEPSSTPKATPASSSSSTPVQTTLAIQTPASQSSSSSSAPGASESTSTPPDSAAGRMFNQNALLAGAAAIIGGVMML